MKRRTFIQSTAVVATMAIARKNPLIAAIDADSTYRKNIGIQLYTLRNELAKDTTATILQVAADGYKQVEPFGFPNADPMIEAAKNAGLAKRFRAGFGESLDHFPREAGHAFEREGVRYSAALGMLSPHNRLLLP